MVGGGFWGECMGSRWGFEGIAGSDCVGCESLGGGWDGAFDVGGVVCACCWVVLRGGEMRVANLGGVEIRKMFG